MMRKSLVRLPLSMLLLMAAPATAPWAEAGCENQFTMVTTFYAYVNVYNPSGHLVLSPLPCWKHLSEEVRRQLVVEMIADIEAEAALRRQRSGTAPDRAIFASWKIPQETMQE